MFVDLNYDQIESSEYIRSREMTWELPDGGIIKVCNERWQ